MNDPFELNEYFDEEFNNIELDPGQVINSRFTDCVFRNCKFPQVILAESKFNNCKFIDCDLNMVIIQGSSFPDTDFENSSLLGINWTTADWSSSTLGDIIGFTKCNLSHSTFIDLELPEVKLVNCIAHEVDFRGANLSKADFSDTDLKNSLFQNTDLFGADLISAQNYDINPTQNMITKAKVSLPEAMSFLYNMDIELSNEN